MRKDKSLLLAFLFLMFTIAVVAGALMNPPHQVEQDVFYQKPPQHEISVGGGDVILP